MGKLRKAMANQNRLIVIFSAALIHGGLWEAFGETFYVNVSGASPAFPYTNWATAARTIQDAIDAAGGNDEIVVTNGVYATGGRLLGGTTNRVVVVKPIILRSVNGPAATVIRGDASRCVYLANGASLRGFTLTNGFAAAGGGAWCESTSVTISNCVLVGNSASVFGGGVYSGTLEFCTLTRNLVGHGGIGGGGAFGSILNKCVLVGNSSRDDCGDDVCGSGGGGASSSVLNDCLLAANSADYHGGGAFGSVLSNCILTNNFGGYGGGGTAGGSLSNCFVADNRAGYEGGGCYNSTVDRTIFLRNRGGQYGGGVAFGSVVNSLIISNSAIYFGGGSYHSSLTNCTIAFNFTTDSSGRGGGLIGDSAESCIVYFNRVAGSESNYSVATLNHSCTVPMPTNGLANVSRDPAFADHSRGDFRLGDGSPCIDSGSGNLGSGGRDLDGRPRLIGSRPDMGAYEFQGAITNQLVRWLRQHRLPTDGSADAADLDGDRMNSFQEWRAGTNPTNAASVLRLLIPARTATGILVRWTSVAGKIYRIDRCVSGTGSAFLPWIGRVEGQAGTTSRTDTNGSSSAAFLYRIVVEE